MFESLANSLGRFICLDNKFLFGMEKKVANVMAEFDVSLQLLEELEIQSSERVFYQILDYLQISFRCQFFQKFG